MLVRNALLTLTIASLAFFSIHTCQAGRDVVELMNSQNVYTVQTNNSSLSANLILPYNVNMQDVFLTTQTMGVLDKLNDDYPSGFKTIDKNYTIAVCLVTNTSNTPVHLVKYSYLNLQNPGQPKPNTFVVRNEDFLKNYPDLSGTLSSEQSLFNWYLAGSIVPLFFGTGLGIFCMYCLNKDKNSPAAILLAIAAVLESIGICCTIGAVKHGPKYTNPLKDVLNNYNSFVASLNPIIVSQPVTLNTNMTTLSQLIAKPVTGNINNHVYTLNPGQSLLEPVILTAGTVTSNSSLTLQYYNNDPSLTVQVHSALNVG